MVSSDFRQLPGRFGEISRFCECERPDLSDRHTKVTAENLRSRRPSFWPAHDAHAPLARNRERGAEDVPHAKASQGRSDEGAE